MALIKCIKCSNQISDKAIYCPNCGNSTLQDAIQHNCVLNITSDDYIKVFSILTYISIGIIFIDMWRYDSDDEAWWLILSYLPILIQTIMQFYWMYKICKNITILNPQFSYQPYWTWLSWFIPIIHFFKPYQIMSSIWDESNRIEKNVFLDKDSLAIWWGSYLMQLLIWYWIFYSSLIIDNSYLPTENFILSSCMIVGYFMEIHIMRLYHNKEKKIRK